MSEHNDDAMPPADNATGWNWFAAQEQNAQEVTQKATGLTAEDLQAHFQKCFGTKSGQIVLEHLRVLQDKYRDFDPELGFYNGAAFGFWRSGQKSIVQYLINFSKRG